MSNTNNRNKLIYNNIFLVIPSWGKLLGYPTLGQYANHDVIKISHDLVIFFGNIERAVKFSKGTLFYLFGLGYYYTKFEVQTGRYITDNRPLNGLLLTDFVYDRLATSKNVTLESDRDVVVAENLIKLPLDLSFKSEHQKTFIHGTLMRNLFIPYKDIILEFMDKIRNPIEYNFEKTGYMILSSHWDYFNQILISDDMDSKMKLKYLEPTAGLSGISMRVYKFLIEHYSNSELLEIRDTLRKLKAIYSTVEFDPMYLYSLIDKASIWLKIKLPNSTSFKAGPIQKQVMKESILASAEERLGTIIEWPAEFKRRSKAELEDSAFIIKDKLYNPVSRKKNIVIKEPKRERKVEPRTLEHPTVDMKALPNIPTTNIIEILRALKKIVEQDYDMKSIGKSFETARDYIKTMVLHKNYLWDMSKYANLYQRSKPNQGLSYKEKLELLEKLDIWIDMSK